MAVATGQQPQSRGQTAFWGTFPNSRPEVDHRSRDEDVLMDQLSAYALGYRESTGKEADFIGTYELEGRGARNP